MQAVLREQAVDWQTTPRGKNGVIIFATLHGVRVSIGGEDEDQATGTPVSLKFDGNRCELRLYAAAAKTEKKTLCAALQLSVGLAKKPTASRACTKQFLNAVSPFLRHTLSTKVRSNRLSNVRAQDPLPHHSHTQTLKTRKNKTYTVTFLFPILAPQSSHPIDQAISSNMNPTFVDLRKAIEHASPPIDPYAFTPSEVMRFNASTSRFDDKELDFKHQLLKLSPGERIRRSCVFLERIRGTPCFLDEIEEKSHTPIL